MKQNEKQTEKTYLQKLEDLTQALGAVTFDETIKSDRFAHSIAEFASVLDMEYVFSSFLNDLGDLKK